VLNSAELLAYRKYIAYIAYSDELDRQHGNQLLRRSISDFLQARGLDVSRMQLSA
jgi:hypothetical protein